MVAVSPPRNELIDRHLGLVYKIAWELKKGLPLHAEVDELTADGMLGLILAADAYDAERGTFQTYAAWRVRGAILDGLRSRDVVSRRGNWDPDDPRLQPALRIDAPVSSSDPHDLFGSLAEAIPDPDRPFEDAHADRELVAWAWQFLDQDQRDLLTWLYWDGLTLLDVGDLYGVTESRVSQLHAEALHRLRIAFINAGLGTVEINEQVRHWLIVRRRQKRVHSPAEQRALFGDLLSLWTE